MTARALLPLLILVSSHALSLQGQEIVLGPERLLTSSAQEPLPHPPGTQGVVEPVWSETDWIMAWGEYRGIPGTHAQRVSPDGSVAFKPTLRIAPTHPTNLVPHGSGYLLSDSVGLETRLLTHDLSSSEPLPGVPGRLVAAGETTLAWGIGSDAMHLLRDGQSILVDRDLIQGRIGSRVGTVVSTDGSSFLVAWLRGTGPHYTLFFNFIEPDGTVRFEEPRQGSLVDGSRGILEIAAGWDGERFRVVWIDGTHYSQKRIFSIEIRDGVAFPARVISRTSQWSGGRLQIDKLGPGVSLVAWWEWSPDAELHSTRGVILSGDDEPTPTLIADDFRFVLGSDGNGALAGASIETVEGQLFRFDGNGLTPTTPRVHLRYGAPDRIDLATTEQTPVVLWKEGTTRTHDLVAGIRLNDSALERRDVLSSGRFEYPDSRSCFDIASNGNANLATWIEHQRLDGGQSSRIASTRLIADDASFLAPPVALGEGACTRVVPHGDGWLVIWEQSEQILGTTMGPDGLPSGPARIVAEPLPRDGTGPLEAASIIDLGPERKMLLFQDGDFWVPCEFTCAGSPPPGVIRTIEIVDGEPVPDSMRTYEGVVPRASPAAARSGDRILVTWYSQTNLDESVLEGIVIDLEGDVVTEPFPIAPGSFGRDFRSPSIVGLDDSFVVVWDRVRPTASVEGAVVATDGESTPVVVPFDVSSPGGKAAWSTIIRRDESSATVSYSAFSEEWTGSWQIVSRRIHVDPPERRQLLRRR